MQIPCRSKMFMETAKTPTAFTILINYLRYSKINSECSVSFVLVS